MIHSTVAHYRILSKAGEGGMGEVYKALDTRIDRTVAVKFMKAGLADRARYEAKAISALNHPNIATLYDLGEHNGSPYLVMEYIEGRTLKEVLCAGCLTEESWTKLGIQIASALQEAHEHGVIHRDLKPSNIMLTAKSDAKILDFGLAKLIRRVNEDDSTRTLGQSLPMAGTVPYMAPEQLRGEHLDGRTDIHALGVILYEASTGRHPYSAATLSLVTDAILHSTPEPPSDLNPSIPSPLERVILRCLNKDPDQRYPSVAELLADLEGVKTGVQGAPAKAKKKPAAVLALRRSIPGAIVVLALAVMALAVWQRSRASPLTELDVVLIADFQNRTGDPIFDGATLNEALTYKLSESPRFNVYPADGIRGALRLMGRAPDSPIDEDTGREICIRQGLKAMIAGSIASLGRNYLIQLKAIGAESRRLLATAEAEAVSKEEVVRQLGRAAVELRSKAGETLAADRRFDVPLEEATTSSLEALKAFSMGVQLRDKGQFLDALSHYKRATELDPRFALAHAHLGLMYGNADKRSLMREEAARAYALRKRVSERERLVIEVRYYDSVLEDLEATIAAAKLLAQTYPRYWTARNNLGAFYRTIGLHQEAIVEFEEALRLSPKSAGYGHSNLAWTYLFLNRFEEAEKHSSLALSAGFDSGAVHQLRFLLGAVRGDSKAMAQEIEWFKAKPVEYLAKRWQGDLAAFSGEFRKARQSYAEAAELAGRRGLKERVAIEEAWSASVDAEAGFCEGVAERTRRAIAASRETSVLRDSANALVHCGSIGQAEALMGELARNHPRSTYVNEFLLPDFRALVDIRGGNFQRAITTLQSLSRYERTASGVRSTYLRGTAFLSAGDGKAAAAEFTKVVNRRGLDALSIFYPLAHLGLARATATLGDHGAAGKAYGQFAALWRSADPNIPILKSAKAEFGGN